MCGNSTAERGVSALRQIKFMKIIASNIKTVRTGIVVMFDTPVISMKMGLHSAKELEDWVEKHKQYNSSWTLTGYAIYLARTMLDAEKSKHKTIMLFSDGDEDACDVYDFGDECVKEQELMKKHTQSEEAKK
ncbi:hypothetical protein ANCCAN_02615, partial [Ancylostoma caninum]